MIGQGEEKVRLIVVLDEKTDNIKLNNRDIVLTQDFNYYFKNKNTKKVILTNFSLVDENPIIAKSINEMFVLFPKEYLRYRNTFYMRVFRPMYSIIKQIEDIVKQRGVDELILVGGSEHLFLSLHAAEGEGAKWWYKTSWFLNTIIKQYFDKQIPILWIRKASKHKLIFINIIRDNLILYKGILKKFVLSFISVKNTLVGYDLSNKKTPIVSVINLPLQYVHLNSIFNDIKELDPTYIVPNKIKLGGGGDIIRNHPIGLMQLIRLVYREIRLKKIKQKNVEFFLFDKKINISTKKIKLAASLTNFHFLYRKYELTKLFKQIRLPKHTQLVTDMTFGEDIILCNEIAKQYGLRHFNFQYVAMSKMLFPQINLADDYYLYSKSTYELYKKHSNTYKYYLPVKMNPEEHENTIAHTFRIVIFTQPDKYTERYLFFIRLFFERIYAEKLSVQVIIKPHYRQNRLYEFEKIVSRFNFSKLVGKSDSCEDLILNSDLSVSMTSSVLFESLMLGKMATIINLDGQDEDFIFNNDICFPQINFVVKSIDELITIIEKYPEYLENYKERYNVFMKEQKAIPDYERLFSYE